MTELDVAKRRKAFRVDTSWIDVNPHGILSCGSEDVDKRLGGDSLSPRQSHAQPSLALTKDVKMSLAKRLRRRAMKLAWAVRSAGMTDNEVADELRKTADPFLYSDAWRQLRKEAITRYGLVCCKCGRENSRKFPINIDHIKPRKFFPELALNIDNLQPLCGPCNKAKGNKSQTDYRK